MSWPVRADRSSTGPLRDVRVLDFSMLLPGPHCTMTLADLGADVIKVEPPGGEPARSLAEDTHAVVNRNKRSVTLDLKNLDGRRKALQLADDADVVVEGLRPGVAARLGIGYEQLRRRRPAVIYCSISGYGQSGPSSHRPGHDITYLAASGALSFTGHWSGPPRRTGVFVADLAGSTYATIAILAALRERDRTGEGSHLDVSLTDAAMAFAAPRGGVRPSDFHDRNRGVYPTNDLYETADGGHVAISAVEEKFWRVLRDTLTPYVSQIADPRFDTAENRHGLHGDELAALLARAFKRRTAREWADEFGERDVCVERVTPFHEATSNPHAIGRCVVATLHGQRHVLFPVARNGSSWGTLYATAPRAGQHTDDLGC